MADEGMEMVLFVLRLAQSYQIEKEIVLKVINI